MNSSGIEKWCARMKVRKKDTMIILKVRRHMDEARKEIRDQVKDNYTLYRIVSAYQPELQVIAHSWGLEYKKNIKKYFSKLSAIKLDINGEDLKSMGYKPSSKFKKVLGEVFALKLNGKISGREDELQKAKELMGSIINN